VTGCEVERVADCLGELVHERLVDELPVLEGDEDVTAAVVDGDRVDRLFEAEQVPNAVDVHLVDDGEVLHGEAQLFVARLTAS